MGDQIYSDAPGRFSLFDEQFFASVAPRGRKTVLDCTRQELRALYQRRYRHFWGIPEYQALQATCPSYPTMDDHELVDNFGSHPIHSEPAWNALRLGALDAFYDYQGSRVLPDGAFTQTPREFHYSFRYGACAVFVMDLRSQRRATEAEVEMYSTYQLQELERFLGESASAPLVALVISVPVLYMDSWLATAVASIAGQDSDAGDRWSFEKSLRSRDRLLGVIHRHQRLHPRQRLMLLSGDVHVGCAARLDWDDGTPPLYQLTSSALSNYNGRVMSWLAERVPQTATRVECAGEFGGSVSLLDAPSGHHKNPYGGLNLGVVDVHLENSHAELEFKLFSVAENSEEPELVFESGRI
jgi:alkaline phosphatase D